MDIREEFERNLEEVKEDFPELTLREQIDVAIGQTIEFANSYIIQMGELRYGRHVEATNKLHFG